MIDSTSWGGITVSQLISVLEILNEKNPNQILKTSKYIDSKTFQPGYMVRIPYESNEENHNG